ncbi:GNAT family N-acetyltransferase [Flammeovirga sp. OC4]|uniref:GNAT family N-acetyltransferase n=1 Tax=Flammeovirga sp. OC4 TaxID=1382345 RepID=UPI0005C46CC1|nr:GNAT family protein [Flammeovirga sp. OC4]
MGRRVIQLKPLQKENVNSFYQWLNDPEVIRYSLSLFQKLNTEEEIDFWFKGVLRDAKTLSLGIYVDEIFIGYAGISNFSSTNRSGEYYIFIGDKTYWGQGVGTEVTKQIIKIAFEEKELERLMLTVSVPNKGGVIAYTKAGFKEEGILRNAALRDGAFHDKIIMSILKTEYNEQT